MSIGIHKIEPITGFISQTPLSRPILLIIFLGYESDRAKAIYENLDPNEVLLIVPDPPYHKEWKGRTEEINRHLIKIISKDRIKAAPSEDSLEVAVKLEELLKDYPLDDWRWIIAPLGTKPQTLGIYLFWRKNRGKFSIIYAPPLEHNNPFFSTGVGNTLSFILPRAKLRTR